MFRHGIYAALLSLGAAPAASQVIDGRLLERGTNKPIDGATVVLIAHNAEAGRAVTDGRGRFVLAIGAAGNYRLSATRTGYLSTLSPDLMVGVRDSLDVVLRMSTDEVMLNPLEVRASSRRLTPAMAAFYERAERRTSGRFVLRSEIDRMRVQRTSDLLRRMPGIRITPHPRRPGLVVRGRGNCIPRLFVDGQEVTLLGESVDDVVRPGDLEGIEVYSGAGYPLEFGRGDRGTCGAILIWTRMQN
ncbi:MAG TPA: carboxypeptidase regulatory-like domain-containing protein [Longimicrobiaceae bacterium]|nr:carboxypeptidase regulatory-like domain-containing protein [Longimicrobiaceae bacterium]